MTNNSFKILICLIIFIFTLYVFIFGINVFFTWDFCNGDKLNLARFLVYQINIEAACNYNILSCIIMILVPICIFIFVIAAQFFKFNVTRRCGYNRI